MKVLRAIALVSGLLLIAAIVMRGALRGKVVPPDGLPARETGADLPFGDIDEVTSRLSAPTESNARRSPDRDAANAVSWVVVDELSHRPIGNAFMFIFDARVGSTSIDLAIAESRVGTGVLSTVWNPELEAVGAVVVATGYTPKVIRPDVLARDRLIALAPGARYQARFIDLDGRPVEGVRVRLSQTRMDDIFAPASSYETSLPTSHSEYASYRSTSDETGALEVAGMKPGRYWMAVESERFVPISVPAIRQIDVQEAPSFEEVRLAYLGLVAVAADDEIVDIRMTPDMPPEQLRSSHLGEGGVTMRMARRGLVPRLSAHTPLQQAWLLPLTKDPAVHSIALELRVQFANRVPQLLTLPVQSPPMATAQRIEDRGALLEPPIHVRVRAVVRDDQGFVLPDHTVMVQLAPIRARGELDERLLVSGVAPNLHWGRYASTIRAGLLGQFDGPIVDLHPGDETSLEFTVPQSVAVVRIEYDEVPEGQVQGCDIELQLGNGETASVLLASDRTILVPAGEAWVAVARRRGQELARLSGAPSSGQVLAFQIPIWADR